jgi:hypothetical protein
VLQEFQQLKRQIFQPTKQGLRYHARAPAPATAARLHAGPNGAPLQEGEDFFSSLFS